jgi:hypothetical protein
MSHALCARSKSDAGLISVEAFKAGLIRFGTGERGQNPSQRVHRVTSDRTSIGQAAIPVRLVAYM